MKGRAAEQEGSSSAWVLNRGLTGLVQTQFISRLMKTRLHLPLGQGKGALISKGQGAQPLTLLPRLSRVCVPKSPKGPLTLSYSMDSEHGGRWPEGITLPSSITVIVFTRAAVTPHPQIL